MRIFRKSSRTIDRGRSDPDSRALNRAVPTQVFPAYEFLALFLIQIGVPTKPKAARIWFSRKRW
jgi:hypothetical protein